MAIKSDYVFTSLRIPRNQKAQQQIQLYYNILLYTCTYVLWSQRLTEDLSYLQVLGLFEPLNPLQDYVKLVNITVRLGVGGRCGEVLRAGWCGAFGVGGCGSCLWKYLDQHVFKGKRPMFDVTRNATRIQHNLHVRNTN